MAAEGDPIPDQAAAGEEEAHPSHAMGYIACKFSFHRCAHGAKTAIGRILKECNVRATIQRVHAETVVVVCGRPDNVLAAQNKLTQFSRSQDQYFYGSNDDDDDDQQQKEPRMKRENATEKEFCEGTLLLTNDSVQILLSQGDRIVESDDEEDSEEEEGSSHTQGSSGDGNGLIMSVHPDESASQDERSVTTMVVDALRFVGVPVRNEDGLRRILATMFTRRVLGIGRLEGGGGDGGGAAPAPSLAELLRSGRIDQQTFVQEQERERQREREREEREREREREEREREREEREREREREEREERERVAQREREVFLIKELANPGLDEETKRVIRARLSLPPA